MEFINVEMGQLAKSKALQETPITLTHSEMVAAKQKFDMIDRDKRGYITLNDLRRHFKVSLPPLILYIIYRNVAKK
jgi:glycerol-3-phosphate dehydrogenase